MRIFFVCIVLLLLLMACDGSSPLTINELTNTPTATPIPQTDGLNLEDHRIFVSSTTSRGGDYGSLANADTECGNLAVLAGLVRTYKALMSDAVDSAISRLSFTGNVYNFSDASTSVLIGDSSDLFGGGGLTLANPILFDEGYVDRTGGFAWTGTLDDGTSSANNCGNWGNNISTARRGQISATTADYISMTTVVCSNNYRLYCISQ